MAVHQATGKPEPEPEPEPGGGDRGYDGDGCDGVYAGEAWPQAHGRGGRASRLQGAAHEGGGSCVCVCVCVCVSTRAYFSMCAHVYSYVNVYLLSFTHKYTQHAHTQLNTTQHTCTLAHARTHAHTHPPLRVYLWAYGRMRLSLFG